MLDEASLGTAMAEAGYRRLKRYTYRAEWSTAEVEHFISFETYGTPNDFLTADFGIRNKDALALALKSVRTYGGPVYRLMRYDERIDSPLLFSLGSIASWGVRSSLRISELTGVTLAQRVKGDIYEYLFPIIRQVTNMRLLLHFLLDDPASHPWVRGNGA